MGDHADVSKVNSASNFRVEVCRLVTVCTWDRLGIGASSVIVLAAGPSSDNATGIEVVFDVLIQHTAGHAGSLTLYIQAL
jgi:hypothetical protein